MIWFSVAALCIVLPRIEGSPEFPPEFKFGAATSSYQIEGGWDADGKGPSIWDKLLHSSDNIYKQETGDVAADSYHQWRQDVKAAAELGLNFYRFSISWPRILPNGWTDVINEAGVKYYSDLIDGLLAENIEPVVTMYHWDLPVALQDLGGWTNPLIVHWFGEYARVLYSLYGDRVKNWITINEPTVVCDFNYNYGTFAPKIQEAKFAPFLCNKYVLLAHAKAYRIFDEEFRPTNDGTISVANHIMWIEPETPEEEKLAELGRQFMIGRYAHPIFSKEGGWPETVEKKMKEVSMKEGYDESRLPTFTKEEKEFIKGTADMFSFNHYTTSMIRSARADETPGTWFIEGSKELNAVMVPPPNATYGALKIMPIYPKGIRRLVNWLKDQYGDIEIFITENGVATAGYDLMDHIRVDYISQYLDQLLLAIREDGVRITGYTVWSLIDNFEWFDGYKTKFGLYQVNYEDPNRARTPRLSAHHYACIIRHRRLDYPPSCLEPHHEMTKRKNKSTIRQKIEETKSKLMHYYGRLRNYFMDVQ
ncbi:myrosinase 1-like [Aricia agestis]|uniref:myrosinase 1-like n=1 Tax=Aricia agestis TaxID=91739 RepID=UPI001C202A3C|nr:myrosinase 1-like [Aricia agestis]